MSKSIVTTVASTAALFSTGMVKPAEKAAGKPTGGADPMGQDLRLPELEIATVKTATGECPTC